MQQIIVPGSKSKHKIGSIGRALFNAKLMELLALPKNERGEPTGVDVESGVLPQPWGLEEIREGAFNRATHALEKNKDARFGLGIENGLVPVQNLVTWDLPGVAIVERGVVGVTYTTGIGIPCPEKYVQASLRTGRSKTAGDFYAEDTGCDGTDWHSHATQGRLPRNLILEWAVYAALVIRFPPFPSPPRKLTAIERNEYPGEQVHTQPGMLED